MSRRTPVSSGIAIVFALFLVDPGSQVAMAGGPVRLVAVAWNDDATGEGRVAAMTVDPPWSFVTPPLVIGRHAVLRYALGRLYAVSADDDAIHVIDPTSWAVVDEFSLARGSRPLDIAVVSPRRAYVTRGEATRLLRLDPQTGEVEEAADLSVFADADGNPDMGMMAVESGRVFVQIRRYDNIAFMFAPPAYLAVVDGATGQLVDVDPAEPGVQAIELVGTAPKAKMHVVSPTRRLFVGSTGDWWDAGGIEMIDAAELASRGLVIEEADDQTGADLGAFTMTAPDTGALVFTTDLLLSTHLSLFTISGGIDPGVPPYANTDYFAPVVLHEPSGDRLFLPFGDPGSGDGVNVFDAEGGELLTPSPVPTSGAPSDLALVVVGCGTAGDLNGDGAADGRDVSGLVGCLLEGPTGCTCGDLNGDGRADEEDAAMFVELLLSP